jgi:hypothetical protein
MVKSRWGALDFCKQVTQARGGVAGTAKSKHLIYPNAIPRKTDFGECQVKLEGAMSVAPFSGALIPVWSFAHVDGKLLVMRAKLTLWPPIGLIFAVVSAVGSAPSDGLQG